MSEPKAGEWWWIRSGETRAEQCVVDGAGRLAWGYGCMPMYNVTPIRRIPTAEELAELERERDEARAERDLLLERVRESARAIDEAGDILTAAVARGLGEVPT